MRSASRLLSLSTLLLTAWAVALPGIAAEDDAETDTPISEPVDFDAAEEMIVSAARSERPLSSIPRFTTVLEGDDLESSVSTSLADALRFVPGLQLTQEGARGGRAALSLRGLDPNHVVVLIDGVRLNDPTNSRGGSFDPTTLALVDVERVEVIRGPLSSVYGSDALAGVINVITRKAKPGDEPTSSLRVRGGRFHAANVVAQASSGLGDVAGLSIGAAYDTFRDPNSDGGYDGLSVKAKLNTQLPFAIDLEAFTRLHASSARSFPESSGGPELAQLRELEDRDVREILFGLALDRELGSRGAIRLQLSRTSRREDLDSPGIVPDPTSFNFVPPSTAGDEYERWDLALTSRWQLPEAKVLGIDSRTRLLVGADGVWEDGESDTYLDFGGGFVRVPFFDDRRTMGLFAEIEQDLGEHVTASGGLRFDTTPDEEDRLSPTAGLTIDIPETPITLFGSYCEGFKRPSFYALGNPLVGNPSLLVEKSRGWEVGLRTHAWDRRVSAQISYFDLVVKDLIDFDSAAFELVNRGRLVSRGVELELEWRALEWLRTRGGATFNPTDFEGTSMAPQNRSRWRGFGELVLMPRPSLEVALRFLAVSSVKASSFQTGDRVLTLAGYERIDLRVGWQARDGLELFFEIENLTDNTHREAVGFESPGIAPRVGLTLRL